MRYFHAWPVFLLLQLPIPVPAAGQLPWQSERWAVEARESRVERYLGRESLLLGGGIAWLEGVEFRDGIIQFDLAASDELGFHGVAFRAEDADDYEHFYLRPFQSGRPDATQYSPVNNGVSGWQIYAGPRHGVPVEVATDRWVHVRMVIRGRRLEVEVDGQRPVRLHFGFSDRAIVYLNGRPVYRGRAEWRSRDHRFLGTVGLFDELILPLRAGMNEVRVAVSEDFGGWGVVAAIGR